MVRNHKFTGRQASLPFLALGAAGSALLLIACVGWLSAADDPAADGGEAAETVESQAPADPQRGYATRLLRGRVVWMADVLQGRFGAAVVPEAQDRILALSCDDGQLYPIVEDVRGRSFRRDERLRDAPLEILARQYNGSPMIQAIQIFALEKDARYELDYWCDICAIPMFELKECDCCQGPIELRKRLSPEK